MSRDPERFVDGRNLYRYVRNNPINLIDPTGTQFIPLPSFREPPSRKVCCGFSARKGVWPWRVEEEWWEDVQCARGKSAFQCCSDRANRWVGDWTVREAIDRPCNLQPPPKPPNARRRFCPDRAYGSFAQPDMRCACEAIDTGYQYHTGYGGIGHCIAHCLLIRDCQLAGFNLIAGVVFEFPFDDIDTRHDLCANNTGTWCALFNPMDCILCCQAYAGPEHIKLD